MSLFRRMTLAAGLAAPLMAATAMAQPQITIQHGLPPNSHTGLGAVTFKEQFERLTNNRYRVVVQRNDNEREMIESVQIGTLDCTFTSTGPVGNFVPEVRIFDVPFLFRDAAHARGVLDSEIGSAVLARFPARGLVGVIWTENGFRHLTNSRREVNAPADMRGLKVRTMENQVHMRAFSTLGALPTPMAFSELIPALQQGTVDGQENPIPVILSSKFAQVQKHLSLTGHVYSPAVLILSPAVWDKLSEADRKVFVAAAQKAAVAQRKRVNDDEANGIAQLKRDGMQVVEKVDGESFRRAVAPAYVTFAKEFGADRIAAIQAVK